MFFKPAYIKRAQQRRTLLKKVYHYRYAKLRPEDREELCKAIESFAMAIKAKDKQALEDVFMPRADRLLSRVGGHYYKHYHFFENIETLVVAAILAIGIRMYFLQPFKIPTNSMWPTYHGMTYQLYSDDEKMPQPAEAFVRTVLLGSSQHEVLAAADGELEIPVLDFEQRQHYQTLFPYKVVTKKLLGFFPAKMRQYYFFVGGQPSTLELPLEFSLEKLLVEKFFGGRDDFLDEVKDGAFATGLKFRAGDRILAFELETGDMLFVDRISYHFAPPRVGDPIVFRTRDIPGLAKYNGGKPDDKYYIKRLVGTPGDSLSVDGHMLMRNMEPISGSEIFEINATQQPPYRGYQPIELLAEGQTHTVAQDHFFAMGDNSYESLDSRYWGDSPESEMVGKAVFIYYPFTKRWGHSH